MNTFEAFMKTGLKRSPGELIEHPQGVVLNLGYGYSPIPYAINLDRPDWNAPRLNFEDESVAAVHMHHFLEHLEPDLAMYQLREVQRVLMVGGVVYITVPLAGTSMAFHDLNHVSFWNEDTFKNLFNNPGYKASEWDWRLEVTWLVIAGVVQRNLAVLCQLIKR